jgi:hypothetical protein
MLSFLRKHTSIVKKPTLRPIEKVKEREFSKLEENLLSAFCKTFTSVEKNSIPKTP